MYLENREGFRSVTNKQNGLCLTLRSLAVTSGAFMLTGSVVFSAANIPSIYDFTGSKNQVEVIGEMHGN